MSDSRIVVTDTQVGPPESGKYAVFCDTVVPFNLPRFMREMVYPARPELRKKRRLTFDVICEPSEDQFIVRYECRKLDYPLVIISRSLKAVEAKVATVHVK